MLTVTLSYEEWYHHVPDPSVWRHTECMSYAAPLWNTGPTSLLLSLLHSHVPRCGVDIICSLKPSPTGWGTISGPCLHPLIGRAFYPTCSAKHPSHMRWPRSTLSSAVHFHISTSQCRSWHSVFMLTTPQVSAFCGDQKWALLSFEPQLSTYPEWAQCIHKGMSDLWELNKKPDAHKVLRTNLAYACCLAGISQVLCVRDFTREADTRQTVLAST